MKKKTLRNQLFVKKETIAHLDMPQMAAVLAGCGEETIEYTCDPITCPVYPGETKDSISTCFTESVQTQN